MSANMPLHGLSRDKPLKSTKMDVQSFAVHLFSSKYKTCLMFPPCPQTKWGNSPMKKDNFDVSRQQARVPVRVRRFQYSTSTSEDQLRPFDKVIRVSNRKSPKYSRVTVRFSEREGPKPKRLRYTDDRRRLHRHPFLVGSIAKGIRKVMFLRPFIRFGYLCVLRERGRCMLSNFLF